MMHILESIGFYQSIIIVLAFSALVIIADEIIHARRRKRREGEKGDPGTESVLIQVEHLTKCYGPVRALDDVSFTVGRGEVAALLGPNGSGKSTLMRCLIGYFSPTAGAVRVGGIDVAQRPVEARREVGYLPEQVMLYPELRVRRYLRFVAGMKRLDAAAARRAVDQAVARCGLEAVADRPNGALSKGYRQRVGLAQALLGDPPVLVLDEPTVGLDPVQTVEMRDLLRRLDGCTVLLSTHVLAEAGALCSRIVIMSGGRIVAEDTPAGLASRLEERSASSCGSTGPPPRSRPPWRRCPACWASTRMPRRARRERASSSVPGSRSRSSAPWRASWSVGAGRSSRSAR